MVYDKLSEHYKMPALETIRQQLLVAYGIINGIFYFSLSLEEITDAYRPEAITAGDCLSTLLSTWKFAKKRLIL